MEYQKFSKKTSTENSKLNINPPNIKRTRNETSAGQTKARGGFSPSILPKTKSDPPQLSPRQRQVLLWAARGKSSWETGRILGLTEATVKSYVHHACKKLDAQNRTHAVAICVMRGEFIP
jgi:DNA-binding CsgD family transcriptional regulator